MSEKHYTIREKGDFKLVLGSSPDCHYALTDFQQEISSKHAYLKREGDRLFLKDLGSLQGTFINQKRIRTKWQEVTLHDQVSLGEIPLEISPTLLLGRERVSITADDLIFTIPEKVGINSLLKRAFSLTKLPRRVICNHVSLSAEPSILTGIMGPSGAGKTILLNLMTGYLTPEQGRVMVGYFDVHRSFGLIKDIIGYVPQDDTLIPELTVLQSLHYCLRLRYPDMTAHIRQILIEDVLRRMGFSDDMLKKLLNTRIGSPNQRALSGGERKRVNIAHELVRNPLLLFLDEPTSGISSVDSEYIVGLLKDICKTNKVPMLITIHQPSKVIFDQLDQLLLLNLGGNVAYLGPTDDVVPYFQHLTGKKCGDSNPAEYILRVLNDWELGDSPEELFMAKQAKVTNTDVQKILHEEGKENFSHSKKKKLPVINQFFLLLSRNIHVKISDKVSLILLFSQAPLIAFLILVTFTGFKSDYQETDKFARTWYYFKTQSDEYRKKGQTVIFERLLDKSKNWADKNTGMIGEQTAQRRVSIFFLLIASSIWFGVINSCREIVSEKASFNREVKGYLCITSYLMAKICILAIIGFIQTGLLLSIICYFLVPTNNFLLFWVVLFATTIAASSLGLLISGLVKTEQASLMTVPILIIPQLIFGGLIRPVKYFSDNIFGLFSVSDLILQKWSFKALLLFDSIGRGNVFVKMIDLDQQDALDYIRFIPKRVIDLFFSQTTSMSLETRPLMMIALHALIPLGLVYIWLRKTYS